MLGEECASTQSKAHYQKEIESIESKRRDQLSRSKREDERGEQMWEDGSFEDGSFGRRELAHSTRVDAGDGTGTREGGGRK